MELSPGPTLGRLSCQHPRVPQSPGTYINFPGRQLQVAPDGTVSDGHRLTLMAANAKQATPPPPPPPPLVLNSQLFSGKPGVDPRAQTNRWISSPELFVLCSYSFCFPRRLVSREPAGRLQDLVPAPTDCCGKNQKHDSLIFNLNPYCKSTKNTIQDPSPVEPHSSPSRGGRRMSQCSGTLIGATQLFPIAFKS